MWWIAVNTSEGVTDLANSNLADYTDQSVAKKTDMPRSSIMEGLPEPSWGPKQHFILGTSITASNTD